MSLEQVYHSLCNGDYDEAYRVLSLAESWRCGRLAVRQKSNQRLVQGYRAALNYRSWVNRRASSSRADGQSQLSGAQAVGSHYRQATVTFQEIIKLPGLWDPFVRSYVDLLESSGEREEAEKVLKAYASNPKNPPNPNAHVFLYEFKKRNRASDEELKKVLAPLYSMTPSHTLMVNYSYLLSTSSSAEDVKMALKVLFDLLDFSGWKNNLKAWSFLAKEIKKALHNDHKDWVLEYWEPRSSWWSPYHFTKLHAKRDWKENVDLALKKALVAGMLLGLSCPYLLSVCKSGKDEERKPLRNIIKTVQKNNCAKKF
ncbi:hypothetical protein GDO81_027718 [Engystomops pustulosus]|uniref:TATA box-binding protein-associated factor RNA polymerase I subunit A n=1 Tax=Engystomops pustulosus TaxID=76066 RepID=A0AAV6ZHH9_ENGPU|nr:hypothetical protein GDO81_027718 [Engystomops pustulosus]